MQRGLTKAALTQGQRVLTAGREYSENQEGKKSKEVRRQELNLIQALSEARLELRISVQSK